MTSRSSYSSPSHILVPIKIFLQQIMHLSNSIFKTLCGIRFDRFISPQLLSDYEAQYADLNCNVFLEEWHNYQRKLRDYCNKKFKCKKHSAWPDEIENVLLLLKLFPSKTRGAKNAEPQSFYKSIDKLIVFNVVRSRADWQHIK